MRFILLLIFLIQAEFLTADDYVIKINDNLYKDIRKEAFQEAEFISKDFINITPVLWGSKINGLVYNFIPPKNTPSIALTFDACGGQKGSYADKKLIDFLIKNNIKSTLFVNIRWIEANKELFKKLATNKLFDIQNHGIEHRPLSTTERTVYGISGTNTIQNALYEVLAAGKIIKTYTNIQPKYFRAGTAYYDDVAVRALDKINYKAIGYSINADYGASIPAKNVVENMMKAKSGDIVIAHINRPKSDTAKGMIESIAKLKKQGFNFVKLSEVKLIIE